MSKNLTDKERSVVETEYQNGVKWLRVTMYCPHTTNPLQLRSVCKRCTLMDNLHVNVYQMPEQLGGDWACSSACVISDGFKTRTEAENWGIAHCGKFIEF